MPAALISPPRAAPGFSVPPCPSVLRLPAQHRLLVTRGSLIAREGPCQHWVKAGFSSCGFCVTAGLIITHSVMLCWLISRAPACTLPPSSSISTGYQLLSNRLWDLSTRVPAQARDPRVSMRMESGTPSWACHCGHSSCSPVEAGCWLLGSRDAAVGEKEEEGRCASEGPAVRANPSLSSDR